MPETAASASLPPTTRGWRGWRGDALVVVAATLAGYALAAAFNLSERLAEGLAGAEGWQGDELPIVLTLLALGLCWFAWRRRAEALAELRLRVQAEARVGELLRHNRELAQQLIAVQESERRALARELHDDLGQACSAIRVETTTIRHGAAAGAIAADTARAIGAAAERADAEAQRLYERVRDLLRRLRPPDLEALGLRGALQELCEAWELRSGVACMLHHEGEVDGLGDEVEITVYRVAQEALSNVMRHAGASTVRLRLVREGASLVLVVSDDGRGIAPGGAGQGLGLLGAGERAAALGGTLAVDGAASGGTRLRLTLPLAPPPQAAR
ncbi:MAG: hypothetical protein KGN16_15990 [Burkholderiales bacterium]|nr:hypothetical protein [Burkholderiales bacterium]